MIPREGIISMARDVGLLPENSHPAPETRHTKAKYRAVERFAALVEARVASADAERYQWLKDGMRGQAPLVRIQVCKRGYMLVSAEDLDAVIDESIRTRGAA